MPPAEHVLANAPIGAVTRRVISPASYDYRAPGNMSIPLMRSNTHIQNFALGQSTPKWRVDPLNGNKFEINGRLENDGVTARAGRQDGSLSAECFFGLSNRVRSIQVTVEEGVNSRRAFTNSANRLQVSITPNIQNQSGSSVPNYPTNSLLIRAHAMTTDASNLSLDGNTDYHSSGPYPWTRNVNIDSSEGEIYGAGFSLYMSVRTSGGSPNPTVHWIVTIVPSESRIP